jgi:exodeoxyribonuclease VII small subunit
MADERYTFAQARTRLEEIVVQVRAKDCSLEKSLDLLEEGVRLANTCTELSDHAEWPTVVAEEQAAESAEEQAAESGEVSADETQEPAEASQTDEHDRAETSDAGPHEPQGPSHASSEAPRDGE